MHAAKQSKTLTASITAKLTPEEYMLIKQQAKESGLRPSEWSRQALASAVACGPEIRLILSELLALRKIFLALKVDRIHGQELTEPRIKEVVDQTEATKFAMAERRIYEFRRVAINDQK
jgi:hypothetical protein